jgi:F-type H+-transporting ATPase subunit epsilon
MQLWHGCLPLRKSWPQLHFLSIILDVGLHVSERSLSWERSKIISRLDPGEGWGAAPAEKACQNAKNSQLFNIFQETWRQAGISYLRYANICAQVVRRSLKEPMRAKAVQRDNANMKVQVFENGKRTAVREFCFLLVLLGFFKPSSRMILQRILIRCVCSVYSRAPLCNLTHGCIHFPSKAKQETYQYACTIHCPCDVCAEFTYPTCLPE